MWQARRHADQAIQALKLCSEELEARCCPGALGKISSAPLTEVLKAESVLVSTRVQHSWKPPATISHAVRAMRPLSNGIYQLLLGPQASPSHVISELNNLPSVVAAEPNYPLKIAVQPNDPMLRAQWALANTLAPGADISAVSAWKKNTNAASVIVAVIDTGVDYNHPDLRNNIWRNPHEIPHNGLDDDGNGYVDDYIGYDFVNNDSDPWDDHGHGTHVAGIIGAEGNNGLGIAGVAWNVKLMALKFLDEKGTGTVANAVRAIDYAVRMGAHIINASWGTSAYSTILAQAIDRAERAGVLFVSAAGNDATNNDRVPHYPSSYSYPNVLAVAATNFYDQLASYSNYGSKTVHIGAPGSSILSTLPNGSYGYMSGTSMAAPYVSGAAALLWAIYPDWTYRRVKECILRSVETLAHLREKVASGGRLNLARALDISPHADISGPYVVRLKWLQNNIGIYGFEVMFNEPIRNLTAGSVNIVAPNGRTLPITAIRQVHANWPRTTYEIRFATQVSPGIYLVNIIPAVTDLAGNLMDQNRDGVPGQVPEDCFSAQFTVRRTYAYMSNVLNTAIRDGSITNASLAIHDDLIIDDLQVAINVHHTWTSDLVISLVAPSGKVVNLVNRRGGAGRDFSHTRFSDQASVPISAGIAPFRGTYRPEEALGQLRGSNAAGTWTLRIQDVARGDTGRLVQWMLYVEGQPVGRSSPRHIPSPGTPPASGPQGVIRLGQSVKQDYFRLGGYFSKAEAQPNYASLLASLTMRRAEEKSEQSGRAVSSLLIHLDNKRIYLGAAVNLPEKQTLLRDEDLSGYYLAQLSALKRSSDHQ